MKHYVLFNPLAGKGLSKERASSLELENSTLIDMTELGDYRELFNSLEQDDVVVICGGDGTLNRFANDTDGIEIRNDILYCACGTGNDFLKDIGKEETELFKVNEYLENLPTVEVNGKSYRFLNGVGYGIDGYCCEVGDKLKAEGKKVNYTSIAIKGLLFHFKPTNATVTVDGVSHQYKRVWIAPAMNGRFYGGGMMPTPAQNRLSEERDLSVMIWHGSGKLKTLMAFPSLFKGEHIKHEKMISVLTGKEITVEFDRPTALQIDGETVLGVTRYTAKKPQGVAVLMGASDNEV